MTHPVSSASSSSSLSQPSPSHSSQHVPSAFPTPGAVAPATFTRASAHAASPSHASTLAAHALSAPPQPSSSKVTTTAAPPQPQPQPPSAQGASSTSSDGAPKVLPYLFDDAHIDDVLVLVVDMLVKLTEHNDSLPLHPSALTRFHSRATPNITLSAYLRRIAKYTSIEKCCVLILLVYIDRVCERLQGFTICGLTVHRFICAAILCASKALCDAFNTNEHYAKVGGISLQEINLLEKEFLQIIDWRLICSGGVLQHYYASLVRSHKDYVLAEPRGTLEREGAEAGMEVDGANGSATSSGSSASEPSSGRLAAAPNSAATPAMGSSQHSSPFPNSSSSASSASSASPYTPSSANRSGGLVAATNSSSSSSNSNSSSSRGAASLATSPVSAMQVDPEPATTTTSRRRKDQHRTPPSPRENGLDEQHAGVGAPVDAYKRTRLDQPPRA
ncbi:related to PHO80-cyclin [Sporisorium reilianum f. sp. reilianum]|uniref:Related to PHO80-cyclin n=1 Tax=Sporisorium reilianum f. sp. reilianum TaxID=72559 RepID=A0A2N8UAZ9_9BASI|nr:related to PHO80-cyclin [Sporisorium reilianum f. sp. reilianum]